MAELSRVIDAHAMLGHETYLSLDAGELLRRMDAAGVDTAIARPMGAGLVVDHRRRQRPGLEGGAADSRPGDGQSLVGRAGARRTGQGRDLGAVGLFLDPPGKGSSPPRTSPIPSSNGPRIIAGP